MVVACNAEVFDEGNRSDKVCLASQCKTEMLGRKCGDGCLIADVGDAKLTERTVAVIGDLEVIERRRGASKHREVVAVVSLLQHGYGPVNALLSASLLKRFVGENACCRDGSHSFISGRARNRLTPHYSTSGKYSISERRGG